MSRIYFHTRTDTAQVYGAERAHMAVITNDLGRQALIDTLGRDGLERVLRPGFRRQLHRATGPWENTFKWMVSRFQDDPIFSHQGKPVDHWTVMLNSLIADGSDAMRLITRIDGQCELHCWAEGPDRAWLAGLIEAAIDERLLRRRIGVPPNDVDSGWNDVIDLLHADDTDPVVLSYSGSDTFPNSVATTWTPDPGAADHEGWFRLDRADQWRMGVDYLRGPDAEGKRLRLAPGDWAEFRYAHCLTAADLAAGVPA